MRILIVDDEKDIVNLLTHYLTHENYEVLKAYDGQEALDIIAQDPDIDLIILDYMMPHVEGPEVLKRMRQQGNHTPVIMLSANDDPSYKIEGLMAGADDYVTKPFVGLEVIARIKSLMRRQAIQAASEPDPSPEIVEVGPLVINRRSHEVKTLTGTPINLTGLEFDILYLLATHLNTVFSADEILKEVWGPGATISSKTVMVHVSHLREKIEEATDGEKVVQTVWGVGYKIEG